MLKLNDVFFPAWGMKSDDESIYDSWSEEEGDNAASSSGRNKRIKKTQHIGQPTLAQMCCNLQKVVDAGIYFFVIWNWMKYYNI